MRNIMKFSLALAVAGAFSLTASWAQEELGNGGGVPVNGFNAKGANLKAQPPLRQVESVAALLEDNEVRKLVRACA